ncbi:MAG: quinone oxidoreductase family protein [Novosphingobium sp.]
MQAREAFIARTGGPEVIEWRDVDVPPPGPGEVTVVHSAVGLNYIDTYHRSGVYPIELPGGLGVEAAGTVAAVGEGVTALREGDRVATFGPLRNAYASARNVPAASLFKLPHNVSNEIAAAALLKACTVECLVERCAKVQEGQTVLVHAAAGGVGLLLVQWLKHFGAKVIGTVSTEAKANAAHGAGADHVIRYDSEPVAPKVRELTGGAGVPVVFDGIGMATWQASLDSLARRGLLVSYGNAGGPVDGIGLGILAQKGSLFVTRPTLFDYYAAPGDRAAGIARVWDMLGSGKLTMTIGQTYALEAAAQAHGDLEARKTTGSTLLIP